MRALSTLLSYKVGSQLAKYHFNGTLDKYVNEATMHELFPLIPCSPHQAAGSSFSLSLCIHFSAHSSIFISWRVFRGQQTSAA